MKSEIEIGLCTPLVYGHEGQTVEAQFVLVKSPCYAQKNIISKLIFLFSKIEMRGMLEMKDFASSVEKTEKEDEKEEGNPAEFARMIMSMGATEEQQERVKELVKKLIINSEKDIAIRKPEEIMCLLEGESPFLLEHYIKLDAYDENEIMYQILGNFCAASSMKRP